MAAQPRPLSVWMRSAAACLLALSACRRGEPPKERLGQLRRSANLACARGEMALADGRWAEAMRELEMARALGAADCRHLDEHIAQARLEADSKAHLEAGRALFEQGQLRPAMEAFAHVPRESSYWLPARRGLNDAAERLTPVRISLPGARKPERSQAANEQATALIIQSKSGSIEIAEGPLKQAAARTLFLRLDELPPDLKLQTGGFLVFLQPHLVEGKLVVDVGTKPLAMIRVNEGEGNTSVSKLQVGEAPVQLEFLSPSFDPLILELHTDA